MTEAEPMAAFNLEALEVHLKERLVTRPGESYTVALADDVERLERKLVEEAFELALEVGRPSLTPHRVAEEAADLIFHVIVAIARSNVPLSQVLQVLADRQKPA